MPGALPTTGALGGGVFVVVVEERHYKSASTEEVVPNNTDLTNVAAGPQCIVQGWTSHGVREKPPQSTEVQNSSASSTAPARHRARCGVVVCAGRSCLPGHGKMRTTHDRIC